MITALQIFFVLALIVLIILFVFKRRPAGVPGMPAHYRDLLEDYVPFYANLSDEEKDHFAARLQQFLISTKITGVNADVEDLDRVLIGAAAIIPVFYIRDWEYVNLREVLVYPGNFSMEYDQQGPERNVTGMVGTGAMQHVMILNKWDLRQGFLHGASKRNTAIHEFVHLVDKMDGTLDGVPEILLERRYLAQWRQLLAEEMEKIRRGQSDIDLYGATSPVECFAVVAEYFFEQPETFAHHHPNLHVFLSRIFIRQKPSV